MRFEADCNAQTYISIFFGLNCSIPVYPYDDNRTAHDPFKTEDFTASRDYLSRSASHPVPMTHLSKSWGEPDQLGS